MRYVAVLGVGLAVPASPQERIALINEERLHYEVAGSGPALVLIHGWSLSLGMWDAQLSELSRHFRVIRYDRRGFGRSSGHEDISWDAADLAALLEHLGEDRAHVLGMSQGGRVALQLARHYPDRVSALVLHGTSPPGGFGLPWTGADRARFDEWARLARDEGMGAFRRTWTAHPLLEIPAERPAARAHVAYLLRGYRGGRLVAPVPPSGPDAAITMDDLSGIHVPTLVLVGDREVPFLQIVSHALAYYLPNADFAVVPGGGHLVNLIEPERYNATVVEFLGRVDGRRDE